MKYFFLFIIFFVTFFSNINAMMPVIDYAALGKMVEEIGCLEKQITELKQHGAYLQQELNRLSGSDYKWSDAQTKINEVANLISQTTQLAYNASDLDTKFRQTYPGYKPATDYSVQYKNMTTNTLDTLDAILRSVGSTAADFQNESTRLQFLQGRVQNAQGQTQAIQAASQITSEEVTQLQLLRQTVIAEANAQTAYYAAQVQKDATLESSLSSAIDKGATDAPAIGHSGHAIDVPDF
jgi:type IV secretion system protein TrbJ